jgi:diguanylate cyclase (GGDEF)-like protein
VGLTIAGRPLSNGELLVACVVISTLLGRQYLTLRDNARLSAELARREQLLRHQALHDPLTGLANRVLFGDRLEHALSLHRRDRRPLALVFLDLDAFKAVNDTLGHAAGDELLRTVARRLADVVREGDTVARLGGDEFAVLVEGCADPQEVAARLAEVVAVPVVLAGGTVTVGASVGVCAVGADDEPRDADEVLACSDAAMYAAKRAGGSRVATTAPSALPVG